MYLSSTLTRYPRYFAGSSFRCHDPRTGVMTPERGSCSRVARLKGVQHGVADGLGPSPVVLDNSQCRENGAAAFSARRAPPKQQDRLAECRGVRVWSARMPHLATVSRVLCEILMYRLGTAVPDGLDLRGLRDQTVRGVVQAGLGGDRGAAAVQRYGHRAHGSAGHRPEHLAGRGDRRRRRALG
jgi:hypothetical protein